MGIFYKKTKPNQTRSINANAMILHRMAPIKKHSNLVDFEIDALKTPTTSSTMYVKRDCETTIQNYKSPTRQHLNCSKQCQASMACCFTFQITRNFLIAFGLLMACQQVHSNNKVTEQGDILLGGLFPIHQKGMCIYSF